MRPQPRRTVSGAGGDAARAWRLASHPVAVPAGPGGGARLRPGGRRSLPAPRAWPPTAGPGRRPPRRLRRRRAPHTRARPGGRSRGSGTARPARRGGGRRRPSSASTSPRLRRPGVSITIPPEGSTIRSRVTVVWRPLASPARTSAVCWTSSPARRLTRVDLPAPDSPSSTAVRCPTSSSWMASTPSPVTEDSTWTSASPARSRTSPTTASTSTPSAEARSALVSTMVGVAPDSQANTRERSMRPGFTGRSRPATIRTWSTSAARTCSVTRSAGSRRDSWDQRGSTAATVAAPSWSPGSMATQSPDTGSTSASWGVMAWIGPSAVPT